MGGGVLSRSELASFLSPSLKSLALATGQKNITKLSQHNKNRAARFPGLPLLLDYIDQLV
jgi:hypothetical protein